MEKKLTFKDFSSGLKLLAVLFPFLVYGTTYYATTQVNGHRLDSLEEKTKTYEADHDTLLKVNERVSNIDRNVERLLNQQLPTNN